MFDLIIRDATIVSAAGREVADVAIREDKIAYVGPRPPRAGRAEISAMGRFLIPGVIDGGLQLFGGGGLAAAVGEETRAAVTGGVTTVLALPHPEGAVRSAADAQSRWSEAARTSFCDLGWWIDDEAPVEAVREAVNGGWVVGAMAHVDGATLSPVRMARWRSLPGLLAIHWQGRAAPPVKLLEVAREREHPLHLYALSTDTQLDWLDPVRHDVRLTSTVTVPHLFLSADDPDTADVVAAPPLRGEQDRRTLWTATKRGRLDCVASHHHADAHRGVAGSEVLLPLMLHAAQAGRLSLEQVVDLCSETPARVFGLNRKGQIQKGFDADLVLFSEGTVRRLDEDDLLSAGRSPFVGREACPKPDLVFVAGQLVAEAGQIVGDRPVGRVIARDRAA